MNRLVNTLAWMGLGALFGLVAAMYAWAVLVHRAHGGRIWP